jgi:hypothetical protein
VARPRVTGGASGLFELLDSSEDWERIGQRLDRQFVLMICYKTMEIYLDCVPLSMFLELDK